MNATLQLINERGEVAYKFTDNSGVPAVDPGAVAFSAETIDLKTRVPGGVVIVRHANGEVRHLKITGTAPEVVTLPAQYVNEVVGRLKSTREALAVVQPNSERARQMEREYLYLACNGRHSIDGLANDVATKICTWRAQFKEPYEKALAKYTRNLDSLRQRADVAAQQRLTQQQLQNQQSQLEAQQLANALSQFGQQTQRFGQQMLNNAFKQPIPQVNFSPFTPSENKAVRCIDAGPVTDCRY